MTSRTATRSRGAGKVEIQRAGSGGGDGDVKPSPRTASRGEGLSGSLGGVGVSVGGCQDRQTGQLRKGDVQRTAQCPDLGESQFTLSVLDALQGGCAHPGQPGDDPQRLVRGIADPPDALADRAHFVSVHRAMPGR